MARCDPGFQTCKSGCCATFAANILGNKCTLPSKKSLLNLSCTHIYLQPAVRLCTQILLRCSMVKGPKSRNCTIIPYFFKRGRCIPAKVTLTLTRKTYTSREIPYIKIGVFQQGLPLSLHVRPILHEKSQTLT